MQTTCPSCGAVVRAGISFCSSCGASLPPPTTNLGASQNTALMVKPSLHIKDGAVERTEPLGSAPLTIGRGPNQNIRLQSLFVSATHAQIDANGDRHSIVDLGSTNGLLYRGMRLSPHTPHILDDGDIIRIGDPYSGDFVTLTYINPLLAAIVPIILPMQLPEPGQIVEIGRAHGGDIWNSPQVSRNHAVIEGRNDGTHLLRDNGSTNGTYVNGFAIQQQILRQNDLIQIGPFKLTYDGKALIPQDQSRAMRVEAAQLSIKRKDPGASLVDKMTSLVRHRSFPRKIILNRVSLCIEPGEFVALVGGSGAGKSTLMSALSGVVRAESGSVTVNGDDYYGNFDAYRPVLGYVPQDDIVHRSLPVSRALAYAARLRLPTDMTAADIAQRIERVLEDVEMSEHGSKLVEQLSGGQRKRVSIASELLADPPLFYLDEPTSGLDPGLEKKMMYTLRRLADAGRTIVLVTHATANISQCSLVGFMAHGRLVYYGPPGDACAFFGVGSGDFADIYTRLEGRYNPSAPIHSQDPILGQRRQEWQADHPSATVEPLLAELWEMHFVKSDHYAKNIKARLSRVARTSAVRPTNRSAVRTWETDIRQFLLLTKRYLDLTIQDQKNLALLLAQAPIIAVLLAFVAKHEAISGSEATFASARPVLFMLATIAVWFGIINAAREITKEAPIFRRERLAGLKIAPYVFSKAVVLTTLVIIQSLVLLGIVGAKVAMPEYGLIGSIGFDMFVTTLLSSIAGLALGLLISTIASTPDRAISIVPLALIPQIVLSGVIFRLEGAAQTLSWLAIGRWAMDAYGAIIDLNSLPQLAGGRPVSPAYEEYTSEPGHLALCWVIMLVYTAGCLGLTMWFLRGKDRTA